MLYCFALTDMDQTTRSLHVFEFLHSLYKGGMLGEIVDNVMKRSHNLSGLSLIQQQHQLNNDLLDFLDEESECEDADVLTAMQKLMYKDGQTLSQFLYKQQSEKENNNISLQVAAEIVKLFEGNTFFLILCPPHIDTLDEKHLD